LRSEPDRQQTTLHQASSLFEKSETPAMSTPDRRLVASFALLLRSVVHRVVTMMTPKGTPQEFFNRLEGYCDTGGS
jgi:hypothetical protein